MQILIQLLTMQCHNFIFTVENIIKTSLRYDGIESTRNGKSTKYGAEWKVTPSKILKILRNVPILFAR